MRIMNDDINQSDAAGADDVRTALRALTSGLDTPTDALVAQGTSRGEQKRRRRLAIRVIAPLAVAAVVTPVALLASGTFSLPSPATAPEATAPRVTVLDPGTPPEEASTPTALAPGTDASSTASTDGGFDEPAPAPGGTFGITAEAGENVLGRWVQHLLQREVSTLETGPLAQAPDDPALLPDLRDAITSGNSASSRRFAVTVVDPDGNSLVVVDVSRPEEGLSFDAVLAEDGCNAGCTLTDAGRVEVSTESVGPERMTTVHFTARNGWNVLASSSNSDTVISLGGKATRPAPLLDGDQLTRLATWSGWGL